MPNFYDQEEATEAAPPQSEAAPGDGKDNEEGSTFLVNKEAYPDAKPGDTFTVKVVKVYDDEMSCQVVKGEEHEEGGEAPPEDMGEEGASPAEGGGDMYS